MSAINEKESESIRSSMKEEVYSSSLPEYEVAYIVAQNYVKGISHLDADAKNIFALNSNHYGHVLRSSNRPMKALINYEITLAITPKDTAALLGRGHALRDLKLYEQALDSYKAAFKNEIDNWPQDLKKLVIVLNSQGAVLYDLKHYKNALTKFKTVLMIDPKNILALSGCGNTYLELKDPEKALVYFEATLKLDPENITARLGRGHALRHLNCPKEALTDFEAVLKRDPQNISALLGRGHALHDLKFYKEALSSYETALIIDPQNTAALSSSGDAMMSLGWPAKALVRFEAALKIDPEYTSAIEGRQRCLKLLENADPSDQRESKQERSENKRVKLSAPNGADAFFHPKFVAIDNAPSKQRQDVSPKLLQDVFPLNEAGHLP